MSKFFRSIATPLFLFSLSVLMMGFYNGLYDPSFNNYLAQIHHLSEVARGGLEFPRELPGFLIVFVFIALIFLPDTRIAMFAALMVGVSLWGQGFLAPGMKQVVFWMLLWSTGAHLYMVLRSSITLRLAEAGRAGQLMGRIGGLEAVGNLGGMLLVYWGVSRFNFSFALIFGIAGTCALLATICLFMIKPVPLKKPPRNLMLKKKYFLYYLLCIIFGARKQIFLTFAPWVLIKIFHSGVQTFAVLGIAATIISLFFRPLLGKAIDNCGERNIIFTESIILVVICVLYGFATRWFPAQMALGIVMICYIIDQLLFAVTMARATYLNRIAESPADVAPTISMGTTLDHAVSMSVPLLGGILWASFGFQWVFIAAAVIALINMGVALMIPALNPTHLPAKA